MAEANRPSFEPAEITRPGIIGAAVIGFLAFAAALMAILLAIYIGVAPKPQPPQSFPEPRLQPHPQADLSDYLAAQDKKLKQSGWIDKSAGIAAIPVDKAMQIIAGRGASAFDPLPDVAAPKGGRP
jgi:hypothetical protein